MDWRQRNRPAPAFNSGSGVLAELNYLNSVVIFDLHCFRHRDKNEIIKDSNA